MNKNLKKMILITMYVALAIALDFIKEMIPFLNMPQGGSINIALIPIVFLSFHLGCRYGLVGGLLWWIITSMMGLNKWFINIPQYVVDYIIPSIIIGLSSIFYTKKTIARCQAGIFLTMSLRTIALIISGAYFWPGDFASGSKEALIASLIYNLPYNIITCIMLMIIIPIMLKTFEKLMKRYDV